MKKQEVDRRKFNRLTAAAFGGMVAGTIAGCGGGKDKKKTPKGAPKKKKAAKKAEVDASLLMKEPHVCRGLNTCKDKGASGKNDCAGQGTCATAKKHTCHGSNECKGQGGCHDTAGINTCKGKGECAVPLKEAKWKEVRTRLESGFSMQNSKKLGPAPAAPKAGGKKKAEAGKKKAETGKKKAETGKKKAETGKKKAETGKKKAETGKKKASGKK